jgi:hypothetical protein
MLRIGFNAEDLAWVIIARNAQDTHNGRAMIEQIIGRLMRLFGDKIGYVLAFDNVYKIISKLLAKQPMTFRVDVDFLAQANGYYVDKDEEDADKKFKVCALPDTCIQNNQLIRGTRYSFSVIPQAVKNFRIPAPPSDEDCEDDVLPEDVTDFTGIGLEGTMKQFFTRQEMAAFKNEFDIDLTQHNLLTAYNKSKGQKSGALARGLEHAFGDLHQWLTGNVRERQREQANRNVKQ